VNFLTVAPFLTPPLRARRTGQNGQLPALSLLILFSLHYHTAIFFLYFSSSGGLIAFFFFFYPFLFSPSALSNSLLYDYHLLASQSVSFGRRLAS
jgi:hypothetical protein